MINANGGWCWYQDERARVDPDTGQVLVATIASHGGKDGEHRDADVDVTAFDPDTGQAQTVTLANIPTSGETDDHNVTGLWQRPDGRYLALYTGHNYGYIKFSDNGSDRIDFVLTEAHPRDYNNGLYHGYIRDGKTHDASGAVVDPDTFGPAAPQPEAFTPIWTPSQELWRTGRPATRVLAILFPLISTFKTRLNPVLIVAFIERTSRAGPIGLPEEPTSPMVVR
ncbi:MAG: hypothetical protein ACFE0O_02495 [Opitutales bacterium]